MYAFHPFTAAIQALLKLFVALHAIIFMQNKTGAGIACRKERTMKKSIKRINARTLTAAISLLIITGIACMFAGCAKQWTCDRCGKTWRGDAYYGSEYSDTLCADCAGDYWFPLPIKNYKK